MTGGPCPDTSPLTSLCRHSPGVVLIRRGTGIGQVVAELLTLAEAGQPDDFRDQIVYIPL